MERSVRPVSSTHRREGERTPRATPEVLEALAERIRALESGRRPGGEAVPLVLPLLDPLLADEPLPAGALVELVDAAEGAGGWSVALLLARDACTDGRLRGTVMPREAASGKYLVLVDGRGCFYPPAAARLGIDLDRLLLVRPRDRPTLHTALELSLRCAAVGAVVGWCDRLRSAESQRLRLAAEAGGGLGLLLRPPGAGRDASFADLRLLVAPLPPAGKERRVRLEVLRRRGRAGQALVLEIDDETGHVRLPAGLAAPAPEAPRARAAR